MRLPLPTSAVAAAALFATFAGAPALADTLASSAISNSFSASVGSVSTSFNASSDASSPGREVRAGEYRVIRIAAAPGRDGVAQLTLRAQTQAQAQVQVQAQQAKAEAGVADLAGVADAPDDVHLYLPQQTVAGASLAEGQLIIARARAYGLELAKVVAHEAPQTFFLVVSDERYRELRTRAVTL